MQRTHYYATHLDELNDLFFDSTEKCLNKAVSIVKKYSKHGKVETVEDIISNIQETQFYLEQSNELKETFMKSRKECYTTAIKNEIKSLNLYKFLSLKHLNNTIMKANAINNILTKNKEVELDENVRIQFKEYYNMIKHLSLKNFMIL